MPAAEGFPAISKVGHGFWAVPLWKTRKPLRHKGLSQCPTFVGGWCRVRHRDSARTPQRSRSGGSPRARLPSVSRRRWTPNLPTIWVNRVVVSGLRPRPISGHGRSCIATSRSTIVAGRKLGDAARLGEDRLDVGQQPLAQAVRVVVVSAGDRLHGSRASAGQSPPATSAMAYSARQRSAARLNSGPCRAGSRVARPRDPASSAPPCVAAARRRRRVIVLDRPDRLAAQPPLHHHLDRAILDRAG